jgi:dihydrofolate synthase/folylpolyglutamate synthase
MRWGLERTRDLLADLDHPETAFRAVHVGGTNGKGSAAAAIEAVLRADGRATGLYTSPHLFRVEERIRVDGQPADPELVERCAERVLEAAGSSSATYFEVLTVLGFLAFAEAGVKWAAVEVGLGGRLDATNVITPEACALTSVSLEHTAWLGDTLAEVAGEKAGIFKPGVPAVLGPLPEEALRVAEARASETGAPLLRLGRDATVEEVTVDAAGAAFLYRSRVRPGGLRVRIPLPGVHQVLNAGTALLALEALPLELPDENVCSGLAGVRWRGRFERVDGPGGEYVVDVAHNPAAMAALLDTLRRVAPSRPWVMVFAVLSDKDWRTMLESVRETGIRVVLTQAASAPPERRWEPSAAAAELPDAVLEPDLGAALERARELAGPGTVLVAGSCHTVAEALEALEAGD